MRRFIKSVLTLLALGAFSMPAAEAGPARGRDQLASPRAAHGPRSSAPGDLTVYISVLTGGQETTVPPFPGHAAGHGVAFFTLDETTGVVCYSIAHTELANESRAHVHAGRPGVDNPEHVWPEGHDSLPLGSPKVGCTDPLDHDRLAALKAGKWYIQIHSDDYVLGELRGQVLPIHGVSYDLDDDTGIGGEHGH